MTMLDPAHFQMGLNSFGDVPTDEGRTLTDAETVRLLIQEARLAEASGLDIFSIGEHYRDGHVDSATPVLLAAAAQATDRIRLGTSVTVLSTQDPVRLYQEFATVDAISEGRAEMVLGRASAIESFPLFGYDIAEYEELFEEKLDLFLRLQREEQVTWSGRYRAPLTGQTLHPRMPAGGIPTWIGIGGSPNSVMRAAKHELPLMMAIIGGRPERFAGHAELYLKALTQLGHPEQPIAQHSLGLVADTDEQAQELYWRYWEPVVARASVERGFYAPTRERYDLEVDTGALFVGSAETVAQKIARMARALRLSRFDLKYDIADLPRTARARSVELLGTVVVPRVRELLADHPVTGMPGTGQPPVDIVKGGKAVHA
ncbi:MAG: LLM class flavin-dependent oxidoreductase [Propionicimonas sp.]